MKVEELLEKLEVQIHYLGNTIRIPGMDRNDVKQELRLHILEDFSKISQEDHDKYNEGWWFKRLKWFAINLSEKEKREPLNKSIKMERFGENEKR